AQAIYKQWFVDFEFPDENNSVKLGRYIEINPQLQISKNVFTTYVEMNDLTTNTMIIKNSIKRKFVGGGSKFQNHDVLLSRITPCLENGKTAFVDILDNKEIANGSTEFIVMRAKKEISPYWVYCLARDKKFRSFAISSMTGSSGRQRVHEKYLQDFSLCEIDLEVMNSFHRIMEPIFKSIKIKSQEINNLLVVKSLLLSKLATMEN
ncbi:MAG: restriction endonuclease subunit S, partial [Saprospiraceae bacterium]